MPKVIDPNKNDTITYTITSQPLYLEYNRQTGIMTINKNIVPKDLKREPIKVQIKDQHGASNSFIVNLNFFTKKEFEEKGIKEVTTTTVKEKSNPCTAHIKDVDKYGMMEVKFITQMHTEFNYSLLNTSTVDIYI